MSDATPADGGAPELSRGGPQQIPRPAQVRRGPGAPWAQPGVVSPAKVTVDQVRQALAAGGYAEPSLLAAEAPELAPPHPSAVSQPSAPSQLSPPSQPSAAASPSTDPGAAPAAGPQRHATLPVELPGPSVRPAAVLCALFDHAGQAEVVLTRRSNRLRSHTGEVSFPGGRLDPGETPVAAALREAEEEVGIPPTSVEIVGRLSTLSTRRNPSAITPFVGVLAGRPDLRPNHAEVERAFTVPLVELYRPDVYHEELWGGPDGAEWPVTFFDVIGDTVWGATGRMLRELLDVVWDAVGPG